MAACPRLPGPPSPPGVPRHPPQGQHLLCLLPPPPGDTAGPGGGPEGRKVPVQGFAKPGLLSLLPTWGQPAHNTTYPCPKSCARQYLPSAAALLCPGSIIACTAPASRAGWHYRCQHPAAQRAAFLTLQLGKNQQAWVKEVELKARWDGTQPHRCTGQCGAGKAAPPWCLRGLGTSNLIREHGDTSPALRHMTSGPKALFGEVW